MQDADWMKTIMSFPRFFPVLKSVSSSGEENTTADEEGHEEQIGRNLLMGDIFKRISVSEVIKLIISASQGESIRTLNWNLHVPDEASAGRELDEIKSGNQGPPNPVSCLLVWKPFIQEILALLINRIHIIR